MGNSYRKEKQSKKRRKETESKDHDSLEWLADRLQMPAEILAGAPVFIMNGKHQIWVENYKSILEYQDGVIRLQTKQGKVRISGKKLCIDEFTRDGMRIVGRISRVEFTQAGGEERDVPEEGRNGRDRA